MARIVETREINIADCVIGMGQARSRNVGADIDELATSIKKQGLLQPICVCPSEIEGKYEVLIGQRRLAAHQLLGKDTIMASIFDERVDEVRAKVMSLTENMVRTDMPSLDYIDVCTWLYERYGSMEAVAEETGLSRDRVSQYVKAVRLQKAVKDLYAEGAVDLKVALAAQDAVEAAGDYDEERVIALATQMQAMSNAQRSMLTDLVEEDPGKAIDELVEDVKATPELYELKIALFPKQKTALVAYKDQEKTNLADAGLTLITEGLATKGFYDDLD